MFSSGKGLRNCLRRGVGMALYPERVVRRDIEAGRLARVGWPHAPQETMVMMVTHDDKWRTPLLERFMELARESILAG